MFNIRKKRFSLAEKKFYFWLAISLLLLLLSSCSDVNRTSTEKRVELSAEYQQSNQSSSISRASIISTSGPVNKLSTLARNPNFELNTYAFLNDGTNGYFSYEIQNLSVDESFNALLTSSITEGSYLISVQVNANDPLYGIIPIATSAKIVASFTGLETRLPSISTMNTIFPDEDGDGLSNLEELLAGTDFQDPLSLALPATPINVTISQEVNDIVISWDQVASATDYNIYFTVVSVNASAEWVVYNASLNSIRVDNVMFNDVLDVYAVISATNFSGEGLSSPQVSLNDSANSSAPVGLISIAAVVSPVIKQSPRPDSVDVKITKSIKVEYDPLPSITKVWLEVTGNVPATGDIRESLGKISLRPDSLEYGTTYTAKITFFESDIDGNTIQSSYEWSFTTIAQPIIAADTTPPRVSGLTPKTDDVDVRTDSDISISFSEPIDELTLDNGVVINYVDQVATTTVVSGRWGTRTNTSVFTPTNPLPVDTTIWVAVEAVADAAGNQIQSRFGSNFRTLPGTTTPGPAATPFTLNQSFPQADQLDVPVNARLKFEFSDDVDITGLILNSSIQLFDPTGSIVKGSWKGEGKTAIFKPQNDLIADGAAYIVNIAGTVKNLAGDFISGAPIAWPFYTKLAVINAVPLAWTTSSPLPGQQDVLITSEISLSFSAPIDLSTLSGSNGIRISDQTYGTSIKGKWRSSGNDIIFTPDLALNNRAQHLINMGTGVMDVNGGVLPGRLEVRFITESLVITDSISPTWMGASPGLDEINVPVTSEIKIKFDEAIDIKSVEYHTGIRIHGPSGVTIAGRFYLEGNTVDFRPDLPLEYGSQYIVYLTTLTTDLAGNALNLGPGINEMHWVFDTEQSSVVDTTAPMLMGFSPGLDADKTPISVNTKFVVKFDEPVDLASIMVGTEHTGIKILGPTGASVAGEWIASGNEVIFTPFSPLEYNGAQYILMITHTVSDLAGNQLGLSRTISVVVYTENAPLI